MVLRLSEWLRRPLLLILVICSFIADASSSVRAEARVDADGNLEASEIRRHSVPDIIRREPIFSRPAPEGDDDIYADVLIKDQEAQPTVVGVPAPPQAPGIQPTVTNQTAAAAVNVSAVIANATALAASKKELADVSTAIGVMLLGMVTFTMSLFYATHFPDPDVQWTTWLTLSETMSLFCGVLLFTSFKDIMVLQFGEVGGHHNSAPDLYSMCISLLRCLLCFWGVQFLLRKYRSTDLSLKAWTSIGGNVIAFAAIDCFGMIQQVSPFRDNPANAFLGMTIAAFMMGAMCISAAIVRGEYMKGDDGVVKEDEMKWEEACKQVENRFASICIGLLLSIVVRQSITGSLPAIWGSPRNKTQEQVNKLFGVSLGFAIPVFAMSMTVAALESHRNALPAIVRASRVTQLVLSMSMGWSLVFCGQWEFWSSTDGKGVGLGDKMTARMIDALLFSYLSFAFVIFLDFVADKMKVARTGFEAVSASFVLGLGLSWQGAFAEATTCLSANFQDKHTRAYMDAWMTLCLCAIVLPAWVLYMLPKALAGPQPLEGDKPKVPGEEGAEGAPQDGEEGAEGEGAEGEESTEAAETKKNESCNLCGSPFEDGAQFCQNCGSKRPEESASAEEPVSAAPPSAPTARASISAASGGKGGGKGVESSGKGGRGGSGKANARPSIAEDAQWGDNSESWGGGNDDGWGGDGGGDANTSF